MYDLFGIGEGRLSEKEKYWSCRTGTTSPIMEKWEGGGRFLQRRKTEWSVMNSYVPLEMIHRMTTREDSMILSHTVAIAVLIVLIRS